MERIFSEMVIVIVNAKRVRGEGLEHLRIKSQAKNFLPVLLKPDTLVIIEIHVYDHLEILNYCRLPSERNRQPYQSHEA